MIKVVDYRVLLMVLFLGLTACAPVGFIGSEDQSAADQGSLKLAKPVSPATRFVDGVIAVGKGLGYQVNNVDRNTNKVMFTSQTNFGLTVVVGKVIMGSVHIELQDDRRTIDINVNLYGNLNVVNQAAVAKIIDDFKTALAKQFAS